MRTHLGITYTSDGARRVHRSDRHRCDLSAMARVFCADPLFIKWVNAIGQVAHDECDARSFMKQECGVVSYFDLDTNVAAGKHFLEQVREPYLKWKDAQ